MRKNNRLISVVLPALLLISWHGVAQAMGKRPGQVKAAAVSRLTPEQERQAKAEFDSLMAIYDPWEALKDKKGENTKLERSGKSKEDLLTSLKEMVDKYEGLPFGDQILIKFIALMTNMQYSGDSYKDALHYAIRLSEEYPNSPHADKGLFYVGATYAGGVDESNGKRVAPYIELVKRHPNSRFAPFSLFVVSESAEYDTSSEFAPDFDTRMWAYILLRKKYDDQVFYFNIYDDPKMEAIYNDKNNRLKMLEEIRKEKQEVGRRLLLHIVPSIGHAMTALWDRNGSYPIINTSNTDVIFNTVTPYCWEDDLFKRYNPFRKYPEIKLLYFKSEPNLYKMKLMLFDIEIDEGGDRSIHKPMRR